MDEEIQDETCLHTEIGISINRFTMEKHILPDVVWPYLFNVKHNDIRTDVYRVTMEWVFFSNLNYTHTLRRRTFRDD